MKATQLAIAVADHFATETIRTIRLYGRLGAKFGRVHRMAVKSAAEAVRALCVLLPGLEAYMTQSKDRGEGYAVFYGKENLSKEELRNPSGNSDIRIAPVIIGSKSGGMFNVIVGAVIIIVSVVIDYFTGGAFGAATGYSTYVYGAGMILGGIVQMLTPIPKGRGAEDRPDNKSSAVFNGAVNTQAQGNPVQVLYGELIVGSAVISAGINAVDQAFVPSGVPGIGSGGGGGGGMAEWIVTQVQ